MLGNTPHSHQNEPLTNWTKLDQLRGQEIQIQQCFDGAAQVFDGLPLGVNPAYEKRLLGDNLNAQNVFLSWRSCHIGAEKCLICRPQSRDCRSMGGMGAIALSDDQFPAVIYELSK